MNQEKAAIISQQFSQLLRNEFPELHKLWFGRNFSILTLEEVVMLSKQTAIPFNELVITHRVGSGKITIDQMQETCRELDQTIEIGQLIQDA